MPEAPFPANESERLKELRRYSLLDSVVEQEFEDATALASFICGTPISLISLVDENRQWFKSRVGLEAEETSRASSFCAYAVHDAKMLVVEDALLDSRFADNPLVMGDPRIRFYAGAPLVAPSGHVLGTVCVIDTQPRALSDAQMKALSALSRQIMALFESRLTVIDNERKTAALLQSEKLAALGRQASSIAHEINNPLESVTNLLYLCRERAVNPEVREWLKMADLEMRRISAIASQTLRFHRQSSKATVVSSASLFDSALNIYEGRLKNGGIAVEKRERADEFVECFEGDVRQVLSNLVTNSIDAMPEGGRLLVRSRMKTDWRTGRRGLALTVADTGTGIASEARSQVFDAFYTTKGIGGSGLGLWICTEILNRHRGSIQIRSSRRRGCTGTIAAIFLPLAPASTAE